MLENKPKIIMGIILTNIGFPDLKNTSKETNIDPATNGNLNLLKCVKIYISAFLIISLSLSSLKSSFLSNISSKNSTFFYLIANF